MNSAEMSLIPWEAQRIAERMLADYDAHRPNEIFAERRKDWITLDDAYAVQRAVAELRLKRGERCLGYKVGCLSAAIQNQLGLHEPVRGYLWQSEALLSGSHLPCESPGHGQECRFVNLAIEGEIALRLIHDIAADIAGVDDISDYVECWFPTIELHNSVFRGPTPTSQELVAGNAMHAGFVTAPSQENFCLAALAQAEIRVQIDGELVETKSVAELPGGPLGSVRWLASSLGKAGQSLKRGDIVLTGSPGRLIPIGRSCSIGVVCEGQRVELIVQRAPAGKVR